jgi:hypothetical protein
MIWGGLLVIFGVMGLLDLYFDLTVWIWAGALGFSGVSVLLVYFSEPSEKWVLIPAYVLLSIAVLLAGIELNLLADSVIATFVLVVIALPFLYVFYQDRRSWWALIPAYVLLSIGLMLALIEIDLLRDAFVATYVLTIIALPFLVVYFRDQQHWWALIPAYTMLTIGLMVGLIDSGLLNDLVIPAYIMFSIALPFIYVYVRNPSEWWPLIPAGVMGIMGMGFLLADRSTRIVAPIIVIGIGVAIILRQFLRSPSSGE